jgi:hypothetical protein
MSNRDSHNTSSPSDSSVTISPCASAALPSTSIKRSARTTPTRVSNANWRNTRRTPISPSAAATAVTSAARIGSASIAQLTAPAAPVGDDRAMGFNRRKMEDRRRTAAEKEAAARRATDAQVLEDAERLIDVWNERQAKRMPMLFSPTIGAAIGARYGFLWVRCPGCRTTQAVDLRTLDRHRDASVTALIPSLSCRACRPNAPFAQLVKLSSTSIADEMREEHRRRLVGE